MDSIDTPPQDVRAVPLSSLASFAGAGLLDRGQATASEIKVAAFNSSI